MINGVSSSNSTMAMMSSSSMGRTQKPPPPPPPDKDVFSITDTNSDGTVSESELEALVNGIEEVTGSSLDIEDTLATYDTDQDGVLVGEELKVLMDNSGFPPPDMFRPEQEKTDGESFSQFSVGQALSSYSQNSGMDPIEQLINLMKEQNNVGELSSININA